MVEVKLVGRSTEKVELMRTLLNVLNLNSFILNLRTSLGAFRYARFLPKKASYFRQKPRVSKTTQ